VLRGLLHTLLQSWGAPTDALSRPTDSVSIAAASGDETRTAGKLTSTFKPLATLRTPGNHRHDDKRTLIFSTPSPRFLSAGLGFVSGRSPPSGSSTQR